MKEALNLAARLFIITAVSALVLALVNQQTAPVIAARQEEDLQEALVLAYPSGQSFEPIDEGLFQKLTLEAVGINEIYQVNSGQGYVYNISSNGYGGGINFILGIEDGVIQGFSVLFHGETPGFGDAVEDEAFAQGVAGTSATDQVQAAESPSADNEIQAISGSTITTTAVVDGINQAIAIDQELAE